MSDDERRYYSESDPEWSVRELAASHTGVHLETRRPVNVKLAVLVLAAALTITVLMAVAWNPRNRTDATPAGSTAPLPATTSPTGRATPPALPAVVARLVVIDRLPSPTHAPHTTPPRPVATVTRTVAVPTTAAAPPRPHKPHKTLGQQVGPNRPSKPGD